ncbi:hypothetical protein DSOUD_1431 [Desulfuromonas soudanensis]|uniref:RHS repeat-associated core domain-containing protein n=1 Tax=Desulfuromonas soudanensis TaxID=1603606 RepID=A0A0M4D5V0_9BACT|nr:RHS repeat-associated core domain-containing protein [Desulfuromonas soudanensis]ALC16210.1 hypothetical protein DSOUD_1431 [Desulfuromonas soudanensis]
MKTVKSIRSDIPSRMWPVYTTGYVFDSFGRLRELTYPDGEVLTYTYDQGGLLETAKGKKGGKSYEYLLDLAYDEYGQRVRLQLGNGVETRYDYDSLTRRLDHIFTTGDGGVLQNIDYSYDNVGNIKKTENQPFITRDATSRSVVQEYGYDDLHRLTSAVGKYAIGSDHLDRYAGTFAYDSIGNFQTKDQRHWYEDPLTGIQSDRPKTSYNFAYQYKGPQPHAVTNVGGNTYSYDASGNLALRVDDQTGQSRQILWNEENRITSLLDQGKETIFRYDDGGTRIFKSGKYGETIYVDPNFSIRNGEVASKHIFAGSTRIATKMVMKENRTGASKKTYVRPTDNKGDSATVPEKSQGNHGQVDKTLDPVLQEQVNGKAWEQRDRKTSSANGKGLGKEKRNANGGDAARETLLPGNSEKGLENALANGNGSKTGIYKRLDRLGYEVTIDHRIVLKGTDPTDPDSGTPIFTGPTIPEEQQIYYFHGDHLGSSSVITDRFGRNYEHLEYFPYGETWVEETRSERNLPFKFTGKELDPETGLYYFGARYYDPVVSVWVSVDPNIYSIFENKREFEFSRKLSLYSYVENRPLLLIDPDGKDSYLLTWLKAPGEVGHAAFGVDLYQKNIDASTGKVTYSDTGKIQILELWPGVAVGKTNSRDDVKSDYNVGQVVDKNDIVNYKGGENRSAEGVLQITNGKNTEEKAFSTERILRTMESFKNKNKLYNGEKNNCSDYAAEGVSASGLKLGSKDKVTALGGILSSDVRTPNKLWRDTSSQPGVNVLKDPGGKVNEGYDF